MRKLRYHLVDVFTNRPFGGNPLAVFTNGRGVSAETMQALTKELNLSESTFVLPPQNPANAYRVRIFTPGKEMMMAGHPTVGTAFVLAREHLIEPQDQGSLGSRANIVFEEGVGDIPVSIDFDGDSDTPKMIWMTQPRPQFLQQSENRQGIAEMLSLSITALDSRYPIQVISTGVPFLYVPLNDLEAIKSVKLRLDMYDRVMSEFATKELFLFTQQVETEGSTVHSRMFAPMLGVPEDPATGAASGPLGAYLVRYGIVPPAPTVHIVSEQGIELGRPSYIHIEIDQAQGEITSVRVGGECVYMGEGRFEVE